MEAYQPAPIVLEPESSRRAPQGSWFYSVMRVVVYCYPLWAAMLPMVCYLVAGLTLGRPPVPYRDDPTTLHWCVTALTRTTVLLIVTWPMFVAAGLVLIFFGGLVRRWPARLALLALYALQCWLAQSILNRIANPIMEWIFD